jgi:hypothetical protein
VIRSGLVDDEVAVQRMAMHCGTSPIIGREGGKVRWVDDDVELLGVKTIGPTMANRRQWRSAARLTMDGENRNCGGMVGVQR